MPDATTRHTKSMDDIMALSKRRGFVYQASEIYQGATMGGYGGINGFWDYGPLGAQLKKNLRDAWWTDVVMRGCNGQTGPNGEPVTIVPVDTCIIQHPKVWEASGHVAGSTIRWWIAGDRHFATAPTTSGMCTQSAKKGDQEGQDLRRSRGRYDSDRLFNHHGREAKASKLARTSRSSAGRSRPGPRYKDSPTRAEEMAITVATEQRQRGGSPARSPSPAPST